MKYDEAPRRPAHGEFMDPRILAVVISVSSVVTPSVFAQSPPAEVELAVAAGRPLRVALNDRVKITRSGQPVAGTIVEPVYAYDRVVIPAGTPVFGHVVRLVSPSKAKRAWSMLNGDFSPHRQVVIEFDRIETDGRWLAISTTVTNATPHVKRQMAAATEPPEHEGVAARGRREAVQQARGAVADAKQKAADAIAAIKAPGKLERLEEMAIDRLPYHPQFLRKGTVFDAELRQPLSFGTTTPPPLAPAGTKPAPASILKARLRTALDSAKTPRGTALEAVVTQPVFSADHELIF